MVLLAVINDLYGELLDFPFHFRFQVRFDFPPTLPPQLDLSLDGHVSLKPDRNAVEDDYNPHDRIEFRPAQRFPFRSQPGD